MTKKRLLLVPSYMQQFSCIGSKCEDSCCAGWRVDIDYDTYKKYNKAREVEMKPLLDKYVKRNRSNPTKENYAKIALTEGSCSFLNDDKLCNIQLKLGEDMLSNVCTAYPRTSNIINDVLEKSATMSCPEAARLTLLNPEGITFDEIEESMEVRNIVKNQWKTSDTAFYKKAERYFWEFRIFTIEVLQNRIYTLAERLIILGLFYQKTQEYIESNRVDELPDLIASYTNLISSGELNGQLNSIPTLVEIQMKLLKELADHRFFAGINSERYLECFTEALIGLQYDGQSTEEEITQRYTKAYEEHYITFMNKHEYILENYLVNNVFKNLFPFGGGRDIFEEYVILVIHYAMIKMHLIGIAGFYKENFNTDHVIKLIQSFAKSVEHSPLFIRNVLELLKKNEVTTMAYMAILIKN